MKIPFTSTTARPSDTPVPFAGIAASANTAGAYRNQLEAERYMMTGVQRVSEAVMGIAEEMKQKQVRTQMISGQIEYDKAASEAMRTLEQERFEGKGDLHKQEAYEARYNALMDDVDKRITKWADKNISWKSAETAFMDECKVRRTKTFAQAMGTFLQAAQADTVRNANANLQYCIENGDKDGALAVIDAMTWVTPETRESLRRDSISKAETYRMSAEINDYLAYATSPSAQAAVSATADESDAKDSEKNADALKDPVKALEFKDGAESDVDILSSDGLKSVVANIDTKYKDTLSSIDSSEVGEIEKKKLKREAKRGRDAAYASLAKSYKEEKKRRGEAAKTNAMQLLGIAANYGDIPTNALTNTELAYIGKEPQTDVGKSRDLADALCLKLYAEYDGARDKDGQYIRRMLTIARKGCTDADFKVVAEALNAKVNGFNEIDATSLGYVTNMISKRIFEDETKDVPDKYKPYIASLQAQFVNLCKARGVKTTAEAMDVLNNDPQFRAMEEAIRVKANEWWTMRGGAEEFVVESGAYNDVFGGDYNTTINATNASAASGKVIQSGDDAIAQLNKLSKN